MPRKFSDHDLALKAEAMRQGVLALVTSATREQYLEGATWYLDAHLYCADLARGSEYSTDQVAGVLAALSPQCPWERNLEATRLMVEGSQPNGVLPLGVERAADILAGYTPYEILGGPKVRSFYHNVAHPMSSRAVTIDTLMVQIAGESGYPLGGMRWGEYQAYAQGVRQAARILHQLPLVSQAIAWVVFRDSPAYRGVWNRERQAQQNQALPDPF